MPIMTSFRPTVAPPGRLARIGVVLDTRNPPERLRTIAAMCDGAGIGALWIRDDLSALDGEPRLDPWSALSLAGSAASRAVIGAAVTITARPAEALAALVRGLGAASVEITLAAGGIQEPRPGPEAMASALEGYVRTLRESLQPVAEADGPCISIEARTAQEITVAARSADDVVLPALAGTALDAAIADVREACERVERDPDSLGIAIEVPVSIGRTQAEAEARAHGEALFEVLGLPSEVGIFGTLEECQERVIELAHAGVRDLRCHLPNNPDIHDVIAQLTAISVGTVDVLAPGAPRSRDPDPPQGWGGRARAGSGPGPSNDEEAS